jgi:hypothetical protein
MVDIFYLLSVVKPLGPNYHSSSGWIYQITIFPDEMQSTETISPCWVVKELPQANPFKPSLMILFTCSSNCGVGAKLISSTNSSAILTRLCPAIDDTIFVELSIFPIVLCPNIKMYDFPSVPEFPVEFCNCKDVTLF